MRELDFWYFWGIFRSCWKLMIIGAVVMAALSYSYFTFFVKPTYVAGVTLYFGRIISENVNDTFSQNKTNPVDSSAELSRGLAMGLQLVNDYRELINTDKIRNQVDELIRTNGSVKQIRYDVSVDLIRQTRLMRISVFSADPQLCMVAADSYAKVFVDEVQSIINIRNSQIIDYAQLPVKPIAPSVKKKYHGRCGRRGGIGLSADFFNPFF